MAKRGRKRIHLTVDETVKLSLHLGGRPLEVGETILYKDEERVVEKIYPAGSHWYVLFDPKLIIESNQFSFLVALGYFKRP